MTGTIFSSKWKAVGHLPGLPVFINYLVPPSATATEVKVLPARKVKVGGGNQPEGTMYRRFWTENYVQVLPKKPKPMDAIVALSGYLKGDAYKLRDLFDEASNPQDMKVFLEVCGPFYETAGEHYITWEDFQRWQAHFRDRRISGESPVLPPNVVLKSLNWGIFWDMPDWSINTDHPSGKKALTVYLDCATALEAIGATVIVDRIMSVEWRECAYSRCPTPQRIFKLGRRGVDQKFCDRICKEAAKQQRRRGSKREQAT